MSGEERNIPVLDAAAGRVASRAELRRRLDSAPAPFLEGALANPLFGDEELLLLLRNRRASAATLTRLGDDGRWTGKSEARRLLVQHPAVPLPMAQRLLGSLFWRDLMEVSVNPRVHPFVRRQAERLLLVRAEELSVGERISLARRAPRGVLATLIHSDDSRILCSLLGNPSLVEQDAVTVAGSARSSGEVLGRLATHPRWGVRKTVRLALLRNGRTPVPVALRLMAELPKTELRRLVRDAAVPTVVRVGAERRLEGRAAGRT